MPDGTEEFLGGVLSGCLFRTVALLAFIVGVVMVITGDSDGWWAILYCVLVLGWEAWRWARRDP